MLYIGVALSYYGFRMFLTRPCLHYYEGGVSGPSSSRIHEIASLCVDYACHIIDLVPEPPSLLDFASLPCWWCIVPNVYAVAKIVVNEASHKFASHHLLLGDSNRRLTLALQWLKSLSGIQEEERELETGLIHKLCDSVIHTAAVVVPESTGIELVELQANKEIHKDIILTGYLPDNAKDWSNIVRAYDSSEAAPSNPESFILSKQPHKPPLSLSSPVSTFQEYLGISKELYKIIMVIGLCESKFSY
jgi:hypothetical protein